MKNSKLAFYLTIMHSLYFIISHYASYNYCKAVAISLFFFLVSIADAQNGCGLSVDAGADQILCLGQSVVLPATVSGGNNPTIQWTPAAGLNNPALLNPLASPATTTLYTIAVSDVSDNLIINGNFETQNILPSTTQYTLAPDPISIGINAPNYYAILDVPQIVQTFGCNPDIGQYTMVLHGSTGVNVNFWCQTVNVTPNRDYTIRYKVFGIPYLFFPAPVIVAKINGQQVGSVTAPNSPCGVVEGEFTWNSGGSSTAEICFANSRVSSLGSMCAIDDIEFFENCLVTDEILVTVEEGSQESLDAYVCSGESYEVGGQFYSAPGNYSITLQNIFGCDSIINLNLEEVEVYGDIQLSNPLNCLNNEAELNGLGSTGSFGISAYQWSTFDGTIIGDPTEPIIRIGSSGTYTLEVTTSNGQVECSQSLDFFVPVDTLSPEFYIENPPEITCQDTAIMLHAIGINLPPFISIIWTASNGGNILSGANTLEPVVNRPGNYSLLVIDNENGCLRFEQVEVVGSSDLPIISLDSITALTCFDSVGLICTSVNFTLDKLRLKWSSSDGIIINGQDSLCINYSKSGVYRITVTHLESGCTTQAEFSGMDIRFLPDLSIEEPDTLTCIRNQVVLRTQLMPEDTTLIFNWRFEGIEQPEKPNDRNILVKTPGVYWVAIQDTISGCSDSLSVTVYADETLPIASAGRDMVLNCAVDTIFPESSGSSSGSDFKYSWTEKDGTSDPENILSPPITLPGIYILSVQQISTGCEVTDTLMVIENYSTPIIFPLANDTLTCEKTSITLRYQATADDNSTIIWKNSREDILIPPYQVSYPDTFTIVLIDTLSFCGDTQQIIILENILNPVIRITHPDTLDCLRSNVTIDASPSENLNQLVFLWSTIQGSIIGQLDLPIIVVAKKGWYYLTVRNINNGCISSDSVYVAEADGLPSIVFITPDTLTCNRNEITLRADLSNTQMRAGYEWSTSTGNILGDKLKQEITVNLPGWYFLKVTDSTSLCSAIDSVLVVEDKEFPVVEIEADGKITCIDTLVKLSILPNLSASSFDMNWFTTDGNIIGSNSGPTATVNRGGLYGLILTAISNGCRDTLNAIVQTDTLRPVIFAGNDVFLNCGEKDVLLSGNVSAGFNVAKILWYTNDGEIIGSRDTLEVKVLGSGTYIMLVTPQNGCEVSDTVIVITQSTGYINFSLQLPACPGFPGSIIIEKIEQLQGPITIDIAGDSNMYDESDTIRVNPGTYILRITDDLGCTLDTTVIMPQATAIIISHESNFVLESEEEQEFTVQISPPSTIIKQFNWTPSTIISIDPSFLRWKIPSSAEGVYQYDIITEAGCKLRGQIEVSRREGNKNIVYLPSAFTPLNRDGLNDYFFPQHASDVLIDIEKMEIFTRWGERVFSNIDFKGNEQNQGWDGTFGGKILNPGVYIWYLTYKLDSGQNFIMTGEVQMY
jgi:gliding motility-associated-like protein